MTLKAEDIHTVTKFILQYLSEHQGRTYSIERLARTVQEQTGLCKTNPLRIKVILQSMIGSGLVQGASRGNFGGWVKYSSTSHNDKPPIPGTSTSRPGATPTAMQDARIRQLESTLNSYKNSNLELQHQLSSEREKTIALERQAAQASETVLEVHVKRGKRTTKRIKEFFHREFKTMVDLAQARMNVFIYGPTGCGKSHACGQLARSLDLPFAFVSCTAGMSEGVLGGRLLPLGKQGTFEYVVSEFIKCYEEGGVFLLDEIDAADPNVLLLVNAALANGRVSVPNRKDKPYADRHPDFVCVAAANTAGTNADRLYSGRNKLDGATLDRFQVGKVIMDYDERVERQLCTDAEGNTDEELLNRCWKIRKAINDHRLERVMSTRFIKDAYHMKHESGWNYEKLDRAFFSGWREDEVNKVKAEL